MTNSVSTVYGPVSSWRYGRSLGIDSIARESTCSFNCTYCQLGNILNITERRQVFVTVEQVLADLEDSPWQEADIVTFSGSGEPTLALNLGELIRGVKTFTDKPVLVLTNATLLHHPAVRRDLMEADEVAAKLDAADEETLQRVNRPAPGITLNRILSGIEVFRREYSGKLSLQVMIMPMNLPPLQGLIAAIRRLRPDEVQLNTPTRPYPRRWVLESRGGAPQEVEAVRLRTIGREEAEAIEARIRHETGVPVLSVYQPSGLRAPARPTCS